jgi:exonuclease III
MASTILPFCRGHKSIVSHFSYSLLLITALLSQAAATMNDIRNHSTTLNGLSISCINVNSLNMASANKPAQLKKLYGILKLRSDVIFLSDTRMSNRNLVSSITDVTSIFRNNSFGSYSCYFNSTKNKRGVGILINNKLAFADLDRRTDPDENYLLLKVQLRGNILILGAIYGPNTLDENFFINLRNDINALGNFPTILGGDWNTTFSSLPVDLNPDCLNMANVPNPRHSLLLNELCDLLNLTDPFRSLYPFRKDYSYTPRAAGSVNRSRIDFFIFSQDLLTLCEDCSIADCLSNSMFDHKAVTVKFRGTGTYTPNNSISVKTIKDPDTELLIKISVSECYLIYQDRERVVKNRLLTLLGTARRYLRNAGPDKNFYFLDFQDQHEYDSRQTNLRECRQILNSNDINDIANLNVNIQHDIFFEMILNHVKNDLLSYQSFLNKFLFREKRVLSELISTLKNNHILNFQEIGDAEKKLQRISEQEIETALELHPAFEHLNGEKMSPKFLKLAKNSNNYAKLSQVTDPNGNPFPSAAATNEYIVSYFESIYRAPENMPADFDGLIENFLGPDICNNQIVIDSKLSVQESEFLDRPLSIQELDTAAQEAKTRSASGSDGFSNMFIKKYWSFFRFPLLQYALCCFEKKQLTDNFRNASVRLIPKKGDATNIKNWRPISLLNCFYKVISRAVNNRLKKLNDRFTSRAQKGFTTSRYLQEVILNVTQNISYCEENNIPGALVSVDLAKAFDTIYHGFVRAAYKFFGVGDLMLDIMDTLGTNRTSRIIFDDNTLSRPIKLGTGRPQGDVPSPLQFNAGNQILLFKLELDPEILSIYFQAELPRNLFPVNTDNLSINFRNESNGETDKTDGLADDTSVGTLMERGSLARMKVILIDFSVISGLKCNFEKTCILPIGARTEMDFIETDLGFKIVNEITLLGFRINSNGPMTEHIFQSIYEKIGSIIVCWDRYKLSLQGRIGIFKTLLLSQLSFHGSVLRPSYETLTKIQNLMNNYVTGNLKIAKNRLYREPVEGGLGLINLDFFLTGLHVSWIKKCHLSSRDNWRIDIRSYSSGNCLTFFSNNAAVQRRPVLFNIAKDFENFSNVFYRKNENYKEAFILNNKLFQDYRHDNQLITPALFRGNVPVLNIEQVSKLKFKDFFTDGRAKTLDELVTDTGINFSLMTYMRIMGPLFNFSRSIRQADTGTGSESIEKFLGVKKGEAKKVRSLLTSNVPTTLVNNLTVVKTFFRVIGIVTPERDVGKIIGFWRGSYLTNKVRDFVFKFYNNQLPINTRLSHYVANRNRLCTFCTSEGVPLPADENFRHLFFDCPTTKRIHLWFNNKYRFLNGNDPDRWVKFFFLGTLPEQENFSELGQLFSMTIQYLIWEMRSYKRIFSGTTLDLDFRYHIKNCFSNQKRLSAILPGLPLRIRTNMQWTDI